MYVCISHNHKVIVEALISEIIVNDVSESNSIVCCMRERACKGRLIASSNIDYTIAQWLEHRWLQARVPGLSPGGDSQFFSSDFPVCLFPSNQSILLLLLLLKACPRRWRGCHFRLCRSGLMSE